MNIKESIENINTPCAIYKAIKCNKYALIRDCNTLAISPCGENIRTEEIVYSNNNILIELLNIGNLIYDRKIIKRLCDFCGDRKKKNNELNEIYNNLNTMRDPVDQFTRHLLGNKSTPFYNELEEEIDNIVSLQKELIDQSILGFINILCEIPKDIEKDLLVFKKTNDFVKKYGLPYKEVIDNYSFNLIPFFAEAHNLYCRFLDFINYKDVNLTVKGINTKLVKNNEGDYKLQVITDSLIELANYQLALCITGDRSVRICIICGNIYFGNAKSKYCSNACKQILYRNHKKEVKVNVYKRNIKK